MKLSICIPTYNRAKHLRNCLNSILGNLSRFDVGQVEICISDNNSTDDTLKVINEFSLMMPITFSKQRVNVGVAKNIVSVTKMATGDFIWLLGDDDFLVEDALIRLFQIFEDNPNVDFFYVYHCIHRYCTHVF